MTPSGSSDSRRKVFAGIFEEVDEPQLKKSVDFAAHRFVSVERDKTTTDQFVKGHRTLRAACDHMALGMREGDPFVPEHVYDLDTGERHDLDLFTFVVPTSVDAAAFVMPVSMARDAADTLRRAEHPAARVLETALGIIRPAAQGR